MVINMFKEEITKIIDSLNDLESRDILKECIQERLNQSLRLYYEELDRNCTELLDNNYSDVIKNILSYNKEN